MHQVGLILEWLSRLFLRIIYSAHCHRIPILLCRLDTALVAKSRRLDGIILTLAVVGVLALDEMVTG